MICCYVMRPMGFKVFGLHAFRTDARTKSINSKTRTIPARFHSSLNENSGVPTKYLLGHHSMTTSIGEGLII